MQTEFPEAKFMPKRIISIESAEHYKWDGLHGTDCDGWHLV
jgi:hypothetical protein